MSAMSRGTARIGVLVPTTNTNLEADMALPRFKRTQFTDVDCLNRMPTNLTPFPNLF